jgi:hypothetical protein
MRRRPAAVSRSTPMRAHAESPSMPRLLVLLLAVACGVLGGRAEGKTLRFEEHDLELTTPADWLASKPETGVVVVMHDQIPQKIGGDTSIGSKAVSLMVTTFPKGIAIDTSAFIEHQREALQQKGALVVDTGKRAIGPLIYYTTKLAADGETERPVSYVCTTFGNDRAVTLFLSSREVDPSTDPQFDSILRSVHFISPYRSITELTTWLRVKGFAHRHPIALTVLGLAGIGAILVLVIIVKQSSVDGRPRKR